MRNWLVQNTLNLYTHHIQLLEYWSHSKAVRCVDLILKTGEKCGKTAKSYPQYLENTILKRIINNGQKNYNDK